MVNEDPVIAVRDLHCARSVAGVSSTVDIPSLRIDRESVTMLAGPPGCGKNLLLRVLGLLETPDAGEVLFEGKATSGWNEEARSQARARRCGYVFAAPFLLPEFTVIENIAMPLFKVCEMTVEEARDRAEELLEFAGLQKVATIREISPGTQQYVALARALAARPAALFVEDFAPEQDEARRLRDLLHLAAERYGVAVVCSVPADFPARDGERRLELNEGRLASEVTS